MKNKRNRKEGYLLIDVCVCRVGSAAYYIRDKFGEQSGHTFAATSRGISSTRLLIFLSFSNNRNSLEQIDNDGYRQQLQCCVHSLRHGNAYPIFYPVL